MDYKYIRVPKTITYSECAKNNHVFAPSKYARFLPNNQVPFVPLSSICEESKERITYSRKKQYFYTEIGDIDISNGIINHDSLWGFELPSENAKTCMSGDILISTVRTYRGGIGLVYEKHENHCCSPAILVVRKVKDHVPKEYLVAILRSDFFLEQIMGFQTRGMYPRLDSDAIDKILIPLPKEQDVMKYISLLFTAYMNKQRLIRRLHSTALHLIAEELANNQKRDTFCYHMPTIKEVQELGRIDTNMYRRYFKREIFSVLNYKGGVKNIEELGFRLSRGQNLQVSNIGKSIYSKNWHPGFYTLVLPMFLSKYGTVDKVSYLGNRNSLKTLKKGDLIFGAEGFEKGRSIVVVEDTDKTITNIHGITLQQDEHDLSKAIFVKCFMDYLRDKGLVDLFAVGGNGGSLAQKYWPYIPFPCFPKKKQEEIVSLYHSPLKYDTSSFTLDDFIEKDNDYNSKVGIYELDKTAKYLKEKLNKAIDDVVNDKKVMMEFS